MSFCCGFMTQLHAQELAGPCCGFMTGGDPKRHPAPSPRSCERRSARLRCHCLRPTLAADCCEPAAAAVTAKVPGPRALSSWHWSVLGLLPGAWPWRARAAQPPWQPSLQQFCACRAASASALPSPLQLAVRVAGCFFPLRLEQSFCFGCCWRCGRCCWRCCCWCCYCGYWR